MFQVQQPTIISATTAGGMKGVQRATISARSDNAAANASATITAVSTSKTFITANHGMSNTGGTQTFAAANNGILAYMPQVALSSTTQITVTTAAAGGGAATTYLEVRVEAVEFN